MRSLRLVWCAECAALGLLAAACGAAQVVTHPASPPHVAAARAAQSCPAAVTLSAGDPVDVGSGVGALAVDGDTVWAARAEAGTVTRLGAPTPTVAHLGGAPVSLATAGGKLWVALRNASEVVGLDPETLQRTMAHVAMPTPVSVVARPDGVWAASLDETAVWQLSTTTGAPQAEVDSPVAAPTSMVMIGDELWILGAGNAGVSPINTKLAQVVRRGFDLPGRSAAGLSAYGSTMWLGEPGRHDLLRVDLASIAVSELRAPGGMAPIATATAACGVWVASSSGTLAYVSTRTGQSLTSPLQVGRSVADLVATGTSVWASDPVDGTVIHVTAQPSG